MKKFERVNVIMRYINNRSYFTLNELMTEFHISRSTAIRDIREIEEMGMPLESEVGRDGGYFVLNNSLLPAIQFTTDEVKALFLAFLASRNQQLPYLKSRQQLAEKLLALIPQNQQDSLITLNEVFVFPGTNPNNPDLLELADIAEPIIDLLISQILASRYMQLQVGDKRISIYLHHLLRDAGHWFVECFDLKNGQNRLINAGSITAITELSDTEQLSEKNIRNKMSQHLQLTNINIDLDAPAIHQYQKYHPATMKLAFTNPFQSSGTVTGYLESQSDLENAQFAQWLLFLGHGIKINTLPKFIKVHLKH
ncbi:helix-turn-helix transcriptional regulator [Paucilactobacillus sp. N302-9]